MDLFFSLKGALARKAKTEDENATMISFETRTNTDFFELVFILTRAEGNLSPALPDFSFTSVAEKIFNNADANIVRSGVLPPNSLISRKTYQDCDAVRQLFIRELRSMCSVISTSTCSALMTHLRLEVDLDQGDLPGLRASYVIRTVKFCSGLKTLNLAFTNDFYISFLGNSEHGMSKLESLMLNDPCGGGEYEIVTFIAFSAAARSFKQLKELHLGFIDDVTTSHGAAVLEALGILDFTGVKDFWHSKSADNKSLGDFSHRSQTDLEETSSLL